MEDKRLLLKQIGWSDELIAKCLSGNISDKEISLGEYRLSNFVEQDTTTLTLTVNSPLITDGSRI
jgi:hypothetical protein